MIQFEGTETFRTPPAELFAQLTDAGFLVGCLPDAEVVEAAPDRAVWKLKPKLSFVTGRIETTLTVTARTPGESATFRVVGKAIGATSTVLAALRFEPADGGATVRWSGEVTELTGLLKMVPRGLIQSSAQTVVGEVWAAIRAKVP